ncbi:MAG TPA: CBS domain-containing protein [Planctomycetaceae bacterium]|nr:CBS domain-containing protein [Planctomycetaceae bacterium]
MLINEVMTHGVKCTHPTTSLCEAALMMRDLDVGPLPVCDHGRLVGMLTDRDIAVRAVAEGSDPNATPVSEVMTSDVIFCFDDQEAEDAAHLMEANQVRRLIVLDRDKRMVGIVSLGDLAIQTRDDELVGNALESISEPTFSVRGA